MFAKRPTIGVCDEDLFLEQDKMFKEGTLKLNESFALKIKTENEKIMDDKEEEKLKAIKEDIKNVTKKKKLSLYALKKLQEKNETIDEGRKFIDVQESLVTGEGLMMGKNQSERTRAEKNIEDIRNENMTKINQMSETEILEKQTELLSNPIIKELLKKKTNQNSRKFDENTNINLNIETKNLKSYKDEEQSNFINKQNHSYQYNNELLEGMDDGKYKQKNKLMEKSTHKDKTKLGIRDLKNEPLTNLSNPTKLMELAKEYGWLSMTNDSINNDLLAFDDYFRDKNVENTASSDNYISDQAGCCGNHHSDDDEKSIKQVKARFNYNGNLAPIEGSEASNEQAYNTLEELLSLTHSDNVPQQIFAINSLVNIIHKAQLGEYNLSTPIIPYLISNHIAFTARLLLDSYNSNVIISALALLHAIIIDQFDEAALDATFHWPRGWEVPLMNINEMESYEKDGEAESEEEIMKEDIIEGLLRTRLLIRLLHISQHIPLNKLALCQVIYISARFARHAHYNDDDANSTHNTKNNPQNHYELLVELFQSIYEKFIINNDNKNNDDEELLLALLSLMKSIISVNRTYALEMYEKYWSLVLKCILSPNGVKLKFESLKILILCTKYGVTTIETFNELKSTISNDLTRLVDTKIKHSNMIGCLWILYLESCCNVFPDLISTCGLVELLLSFSENTLKEFSETYYQKKYPLTSQDTSIIACMSTLVNKIETLQPSILQQLKRFIISQSFASAVSLLIDTSSILAPSIKNNERVPSLCCFNSYNNNNKNKPNNNDNSHNSNNINEISMESIMGTKNIIDWHRSLSSPLSFLLSLTSFIIACDHMGDNNHRDNTTNKTYGNSDDRHNFKDCYNSDNMKNDKDNTKTNGNLDAGNNKELVRLFVENSDIKRYIKKIINTNYKKRNNSWFSRYEAHLVFNIVKLLVRYHQDNGELGGKCHNNNNNIDTANNKNIKISLLDTMLLSKCCLHHLRKGDEKLGVELFERVLFNVDFNKSVLEEREDDTEDISANANVETNNRLCVMGGNVSCVDVDNSLDVSSMKVKQMSYLNDLSQISQSYLNSLISYKTFNGQSFESFLIGHCNHMLVHQTWVFQPIIDLHRASIDRLSSEEAKLTANLLYSTVFSLKLLQYYLSFYNIFNKFLPFPADAIFYYVTMALVNAGDRLLYVEFDSRDRNTHINKTNTTHDKKVQNKDGSLKLKEDCERCVTETINENNKDNFKNNTSDNSEINCVSEITNKNNNEASVVIDIITDIVRSLCFIYGFINNVNIENNTSSLSTCNYKKLHNRQYRNTNKHTFTPSLYKRLINEYSSTFGIISGFDQMLLIPLLFCAHVDDHVHNDNGKKLNVNSCTYIEDIMAMLWLEGVECLRFVRVHPSQLLFDVNLILNFDTILSNKRIILAYLTSLGRGYILPMRNPTLYLIAVTYLNRYIYFSPPNDCHFDNKKYIFKVLHDKFHQDIRKDILMYKEVDLSDIRGVKLYDNLPKIREQRLKILSTNS